MDPLTPSSEQLHREYVEARRILLDALEALGEQRASVIVAGAQAVYLQAGPGRLPVADHTTDGDLALDPERLADEPSIASLMEAGGFELRRRDGHPQPGVWEAQATGLGDEVTIPIDLIVPAGAAPPGGSRGARLGPHGKRAARKATGLEAALVDNATIRVRALDPSDGRSATVKVAGAAALLVSKAHKISDRIKSDREDRLDDKDAADVLRLMQAFQPAELAGTLIMLRDHPTAGDSTSQGISLIEQLFGSPRAAGTEMAVRALRIAMLEDRVRAVSVAYVAALRDALGD